VPDAITFVVLVLAAYRLTRLAGWDEFPLAKKLRAWIIGERWVTALEESLRREFEKPVDDPDQPTERLTSQFPRPAMQEIGRSEDDPIAEALGLPGKQPHSEVDDVRPAYDRPTLAHLFHCPFCLGWWMSLASVAAWWVWHPMIYPLVPLAVSGAVGVVAKNLDA
jgi:hypothetical protein